MPAHASFTRGVSAHAALFGMGTSQGVLATKVAPSSSQQAAPVARPAPDPERGRRASREARGGSRQTAWLLSFFDEAGADRGDSLAHEEDRQLVGVPARRIRVAEIGSAVVAQRSTVPASPSDSSERRKSDTVWAGAQLGWQSRT